MCIIGFKRVVFEGGSRGPPPELFLAVFIQNIVTLCNNDGYMYVLGYFETTRGQTVLKSSDNKKRYIVHKVICVGVHKWGKRTLML